MLTEVASITPINRAVADSVDPSLVDDLGSPAVSAEDLVDAMDEHTRRLLLRAPKSRRGGLVPRALVLADLLGLTLAYLVATLLSGGDGALGSHAS